MRSKSRLKSTHGFKETFDQKFTEVKVISLPRGPEGAITLVRVEGASKAPRNEALFAERAGYRRIKVVLEECPGTTIGPWAPYEQTLLGSWMQRTDTSRIRVSHASSRPKGRVPNVVGIYYIFVRQLTLSDAKPCLASMDVLL